MLEEHQRRLTKNLLQIKNSNLFEATDQFLQDGDITSTDEEIIRNEPTSTGKNKKLIEILVHKSDSVFRKILKWLKIAGHNDLVERLTGDDDMTEINKEIETINNIITTTLSQKFEESSDGLTELEDALNIVIVDIRQHGEYMDPSLTERILKQLLKTLFPHTQMITRKKKKGRLFVQGLHIKGPEATADVLMPHKGVTDKRLADTDLLCPSENKDDVGSFFTDKTIDEVAKWLQPVVKANDISSQVVQIFIDEEIGGKAFEHMTVRDLQDIIPDLKWGKCKALLVDRDTEMQTSKCESKCPDKSKRRVAAPPPKIAALRKFEHVRKLGDIYVYGSKIPETESRPTNKINPIRKFVDMSKHGSKVIVKSLVKDMVNFASACMNERTNGTVHFGITNELVEGIQVDITTCSKACTDGIKANFFKEQVELAMRCIRPPQFVPVSGSKYQNVFVVEIDIVPSSGIIGNETIYLQSPGNGDERHIFRINEYGDAIEINGPTIEIFIKEKAELTTQREQEESKLHRHCPLERDMRKELRDFLCSGGDILEEELYPLVFTSPVDKDMDKDYLKKHFEFFKCLDVRAVFDFDHRVDGNTLANSLSEQGEVYLTKHVDEFDDSKETIQSSEIQDTFEVIKHSSHTSWIYCNGFSPNDIPALDARQWTKEKTNAFRHILNFYKEQIPKNRARVLVLLLSKDFEVIAEAVSEISILFPQQWIVLAENELIAEAWKELMLKYHSIRFDMATLNLQCLQGMHWDMLNQTILQLTGPPVSVTCEIPTQTGCFYPVSTKLRNDLCDLEILSVNECANEQHHRNEDEKFKHQQNAEQQFYRGIQVNWWNYFYQGQVLVRKNHTPFVSQIQDVLKGGITYGEKIGKAIIYHQPGAGGTTSARQVLWDLRSKYPCCCVNKITNQTADQIQKLRTIANEDSPKPPLILLDNEDDERTEKLLDDLARIAKNENCKVFCMLLLCCRKIRPPYEKSVSMTLKHELLPEEIVWFERKHKDLHDAYEKKTGVHPNFLIAFNIMKSNFSKESIQRCVHQFVDNIPEREIDFLMYLALVNAYDLDYHPLPVSCFDPIMRTSSGKKWEQKLEQAIRILLNRTQRSSFLGGKVVSMRIISPLLSKEILNYIMQTRSLDLAETACTFLASKMFFLKHAANNVLFKCAASLLKKRRWLIKNEDGREKPIQEFLSPLLQDIVNAKNESGAIKVVELGFDRLRDPMIAQQAARLHMELQNMQRAEEMIKVALQQSPNNSYLLHTYGTLFRNQLLQIYKQGIEQKEISRLVSSEALCGLQYARKAIEKYQQSEAITKQGSQGASKNPFGLTGILETVVHLLDTLSLSELFEDYEDLHRSLVHTVYQPKYSGMIGQENIMFLKHLHRLVDETTDILEGDLNTVKSERRTEQNNILSFVSAGLFLKLKTSINTYFGEDRDAIPSTLSDIDTAEFRRRRAKCLGCTSLIGIMKQKLENIDAVVGALKHASANIEANAGELFDCLVAISCILKLECDFGRKSSSEILFSKCQSWSKTYYERARKSTKHSLESCLFIVLLNWPHPVELQNHPVNHDLLKSAMDTLLSRSVTQRRKQWPVFFIGINEGYSRVIHSRTVKLHNQAKSKNPFRSRLIFNRLRRFEGYMQKFGKEVSVNFQSSSNPGALKIHIPLAISEPNQTMWNKQVNFVVGLGTSGIHAYDVTTDSRDELMAQVVDIPRRQPEVAIYQQNQPLSTQPQTRSDVEPYIDMPQLLSRFRIVTTNLSQCLPDNQRRELQHKKAILDNEIRRRAQSRIAEVESSKYFW